MSRPYSYQQWKSTMLQSGAQRTIYCSMSAKPEEMIVDFRKKETKTHTCVDITGADVERVNCFRLLGITIIYLGHHPVPPSL